MGWMIKIIAFIIIGYFIFYRINTKNLKTNTVNGILKSKFVEKDSVIKNYLSSSLSYFKQREKYFVTIEVETGLITERVNKEVYYYLKIEKSVKLIRYYTRITSKLVRSSFNQ